MSETASQALYCHLSEACNILRGPVNQDEYKSYVAPRVKTRNTPSL